MYILYTINKLIIITNNVQINLIFVQICSDIKFVAALFKLLREHPNYLMDIL